MGCLPHSLCPCWPQLCGPLPSRNPKKVGAEEGEPQNGGGVSRGEPVLPSPSPPFPPTNRKSAAGFHGDGAGLVGWTGRQGRDRGKYRFLREPLPSALHIWPPTLPHTFLGTEARGAADRPPNMGPAPDHRDRDRR